MVLDPGPLLMSPSYPPPSPSYHLYPNRFHQLVLFCLLVLTNAVVWVSFSAIIKESQAVYNVSSAWINLVSLSFQIFFLPGTVLSYLCMEQGTGLRTTLLAGAVLTTVGVALRFVSIFWGGYALLLVGSCFAALAQPLLLNLAPDLAGLWFGSKARDLVTSLAFMCSPLGNAVGVAVAPFFVAAAQQNDDDGMRKGMRSFLLVQFVVIGVITLWAWVGLRDRPPTPPSRAAETLLQEQQLKKARRKRESQRSRAGFPPPSSSSSGWWKEMSQGLRRDLGDCLSNSSYLLLLFGFGLGLGFFNSLLTVLGQLLTPCDYSDAEAGTLGAIFLGAGLVGALAAGLMLDATHQYGRCLKVGFAGAWFAAILFVCALRPENFTWLAVCFALLGFLMLPLLPVSVENAVEITWPTVPEFLSSGVLLCVGNLLGIPLAALFSLTIDHYHGSCTHVMKPAAILVVVVVTVACVPILAYRPTHFKRWEAEKGLRRNYVGLKVGEEEVERI